MASGTEESDSGNDFELMEDAIPAGKSMGPDFECSS